MRSRSDPFQFPSVSVLTIAIHPAVSCEGFHPANGVLPLESGPEPTGSPSPVSGEGLTRAKVSGLVGFRVILRIFRDATLKGSKIVDVSPRLKMLCKQYSRILFGDQVH